MDGVIVSTSPLQQLAAYVKDAAARAGYDLTPDGRRGDKARLARDARMADQGILTRLLDAERMPKPETLYGLAQALGVDYRDLFVEAGILPREVVESDTTTVGSPLTPDAVAARWGIRDEESVARLRAVYDKAADRRSDEPPADEPGSAEAQ